MCTVLYRRKRRKIFRYIATEVVVVLCAQFLLISFVYHMSLRSCIDSSVTEGSIRMPSTEKMCCDLSCSKIYQHNVPSMWNTRNPKWYRKFKLQSETVANVTYGSIHVISAQAIDYISSKVNDKDLIILLKMKNTTKIKEHLIKNRPIQLSQKEEISIFTDVFVSSRGWVIQKNSCFAVRDGIEHDKTHEWPNTETPLRIYDNAISIAIQLGQAVYHFLMDSFLGLRLLSLEPKTVIHVTTKSEYVLQWFKFLGLNESLITTGNIFTKNLIVPSKSRAGFPSLSQMRWLRKISGVKNENLKKSVLLMKRTRKRKVSNNQEVEIITKMFCENNGFEIDIHDDSHLPALESQIKMFSRANIILGPHGAGFVNIFAATPGACVIEFISPIQFEPMYLHMSHILGLNYTAISMSSHFNVDVNELERALLYCLSI